MPDYSNISKSLRFAGRNRDDFTYSYRLSVRESPPFLAVERNGTMSLYRRFSRFTFKIYARRPVLKAFLKFFLPAIFILIVTLYTYLLPLKDLVTRISVIGSMLVAAVMFHVGLDSQLPVAGVLSLADVFMICLYIVILTAMLLSMLLLRLKLDDKERLAKVISTYTVVR